VPVKLNVDRGQCAVRESPVAQKVMGRLAVQGQNGGKGLLHRHSGTDEKKIYFLEVLGFELRTLSLLGRCSAT
jgi:hypothetical protein